MAHYSKNSIRRALFAGVCMTSLVIMTTVPSMALDGDRLSPADATKTAPPTALAEGGAAVEMAGAVSAPGVPASEVIETNRYHMRLMTQIFDGAKDFSHTQVASFARMRQGNESWTMMDFGDGAVVITRPTSLAASGFRNMSGVELGVRYNYDTKTLSGDSDVARFHNEYVRPQLDQGPTLGSDAEWSAAMPLSALGVPGLEGPQVTIGLSRQYFTYQGKSLVLLQYDVPAISIDADGNRVVHWGRGFALSDPGFADIYASVSLHRSVVDEGDGDARPYRYYRAAFASDDHGKPMLDIRKIPAVAKIYDSYFGSNALQVIPFDADGIEPDQRPIKLAANLEVMAFSLAENGANDNGTLSGAQTSTQRGAEQAYQTAGYVEKANTIGTALYQNQSVQELSVIFTPKANALADQAASIVRSLDQAQSSLAEKTAAYKAAVNGSDGYATKINTAAQTQLTGATNRANAALDEIARLKADLAGYDAEIAAEARKANPVLLDGLEAEAQQVARRLGAAQTEYNNASALADQIVLNVRNYEAIESARVKVLETQVKTAAQSVARHEESLQRLGQQVAEFTAEVKEIPPGKFNELMQALGNSKAGAFLKMATPILDAFSVGANAYTTASATVNTGTALRNDQSQGQLQLTRSYGSGRSLFDLGLDIAALYANAYTGNGPAFMTDAIAITTGSVGDIIISLKGIKDVNRLNLALLEESGRLHEELSRKRSAKIASLGLDLADVRADLADLRGSMTDAQRMAKEMLEERRQAREEAEQADREREAQLEREARRRAQREEEARQEAERKRKEKEYIEGANERLQDLKPDYPTYEYDPAKDPKNKDDPAAGDDDPTTPAADPDDPSGDPAADPATDPGDPAADPSPPAADPTPPVTPPARRPKPTTTVAPLTTSPLNTSPITIVPVDFEPPTWTPPVWDPPVWVPPEFEPPVITPIDWTNFDDDDYPGGDDIPAYTYEDMSGTVETDLSRWAEWLATQDIAKLTRLALQAGYPNLASALADAENIIRLSQDSGYRQWALRAPSCGGYVGCGPSYLERWAMKRSIVALGDILNMSRGIFSTGGFSDIGISGLQLMYLLRDFGLEDGDIIDVVISQFGRDIFTKRVTLTNAGEDFNIRLRAGVAQLVITAVNEGTASPNTAEIDIKNVVKGEANQTYNLRTGQTAVLRIESNAKREE